MSERRIANRFPEWAGFERAPEGRLLDQIVDLRAALGVAYERAVGFAKGTHVHDRHMLVCARGSSVMDIVAGKQRRRADSRHLVWVPRHVPHADEAVTTLYDTVALYPDPTLLLAAAREARLEQADLDRIEKRLLTGRRSGFFDELLERYFFARIVSRRRIDAFQELQLLAEALRVLVGGRPRRGEVRATVGPVDERATIVADRAMRYIEANLFLPITLSGIATATRTSVSTLARHFQDSFAETPYAYIQHRRLDEARHLLSSGRHPVCEVALLVGYQDFSAFSKAFRRRFGRPPSTFVPDL
jgi:AraC-like DNA-binding protein